MCQHFLPTEKWQTKRSKQKDKNNSIYREKKWRNSIVQHCKSVYTMNSMLARYLQTTPWQFIKEYISSSLETGTTSFKQCALQHLHFQHVQQPQQPSTHRSLQSSPVIFQSKTRFITWSILQGKPSNRLQNQKFEGFIETNPNVGKNKVFFYPYLGLLDWSSSRIIFDVNCWCHDFCKKIPSEWSLIFQ